MSSYDDSVFVNCPFDADYQPIHNAIIFAIYSCGYLPRSAQEIDNSGIVRIEKITTIIRESKFGIHDISRTEPDLTTNLPRFNMPLEHGFFSVLSNWVRRSKETSRVSFLIETVIVIGNSFQISVVRISKVMGTPWKQLFGW